MCVCLQHHDDGEDKDTAADDDMPAGAAGSNRVRLLTDIIQTYVEAERYSLCLSFRSFVYLSVRVTNWLSADSSVC